MDKKMKVTEILANSFHEDFVIDAKVYDAADYGVPQHRNRAIIKMYRKGLAWGEPEKSPWVTVREAIGHLPSIEAGESSDIKWHFARKHSARQVEAMAHTPEGHSAWENKDYYPQKENGERIKAYSTTYRRIKWDEPAPTITMRNDAISSQMNVHPGRKNDDGTYSDARVLTPLELMLLSSLPADWNIPDDTPEILHRECIGESIPPLLVKKIVGQIQNDRQTAMTRIERPKWILYRHTSSFEYLCTVAETLKSFSKTTITNEEKARLNLKLKDMGLYSERNPDLPLDAINHKINQLAYYMFGYKTRINGINRFMFSPLGNLLLKYVHDRDKVSKIFLTMLWALQYRHPFSGTAKEFQLYPFRLIYRLLSDERLDYKLYAFEVAYLVVFTKTMDEEAYERLVRSILELRSLSDTELTDRFLQDRHAYVNSAYEWDYYISEFLKSAGVLKKTKGAVICKLQQGNTATYRKITRNAVSIPENLTGLAGKLQNRYSFLDKPIPMDDKGRLQIDIIKEIYSFYPDILLSEIGETQEIGKLLELPKLIEQYSNNPEHETAYLFENVLIDGFNMFYNVDAKGIGGSGHTDIECLYLDKKKKFAVESKSTANKLLGINVGRLREHREEIGGEYTIVVTPRYVPAAKRDISGTPTVIILASTFAEYLYNCIDNDIRKIDYADFDKIITENLGKDVSGDISALTVSKFSASAAGK